MAGVFCLIAFVSFDLWLRNWGHFFLRSNTLGGWRQFPVVLVVSGLAPLVFPNFGFYITLLHVPTNNLQELL